MNESRKNPTEKAGLPANAKEKKLNVDNSNTTRKADALDQIQTQNPRFILIDGKYAYGNITNSQDPELEDGLYRFERQADGHFPLKPKQADWITKNPIEVLYGVSDIEGGGYGIVISFKPMNGRATKLKIMKADLTGNSKVISELMGQGMKINKAQHPNTCPLMEFLRLVEPPTWKWVSRKTGWQRLEDGTLGFVLHNESIGFGGIPVEYIGEQVGRGYMRRGGTLESWQKNISIPIGAACKRGVFAICAGLTAPLLPIMNQAGMGFHFVTGSSKGKTSILTVARSVLGDFDLAQRRKHITWNESISASEKVMESHNQLPLCLDEISTFRDKKELPDWVYSLIEGEGRLRATASMGLREQIDWLPLILSSGEEFVKDMGARYRCNYQAGREIRFMEFEADAGTGKGIFEKDLIDPITGKVIFLNGITGGLELETYLNHQMKRNFGTALPALLECLVKLFEEGKEEIIKETLFKLQSDFIDRVVKPSVKSSQVRRAAKNFGAVYAVGAFASGGLAPGSDEESRNNRCLIDRELLDSLGYKNVDNITGFLPDQVFEGCKTCFEAWLTRFGSDDDGELGYLKQQIYNFINTNLANFCDKDGKGTSYKGFIGWKRVLNNEIEVYLTSDLLKKYFLKISGSDFLKDSLVKMGLMKAELKNGKMYQVRKDLTHPSGIMRKNWNVYCFVYKIDAESDPKTPEDDLKDSTLPVGEFDP